MSIATLPNVMIYLSSSDAAASLDFYRTVFNAEEVMRWTDPEAGPNLGKIGHAEFIVNGQHFFIADDYPQMSEAGVRSPALLGGSSLSLWLRVEDIEAVLERALASGALLKMPVRDDEDGGRRCRISDPGGHIWTLAQA